VKIETKKISLNTLIRVLLVTCRQNRGLHFFGDYHWWQAENDEDNEDEEKSETLHLSYYIHYKLIHLQLCLVSFTHPLLSLTLSLSLTLFLSLSLSLNYAFSNLLTIDLIHDYFKIYHSEANIIFWLGSIKLILIFCVFILTYSPSLDSLVLCFFFSFSLSLSLFLTLTNWFMLKLFKLDKWTFWI